MSLVRKSRLSCNLGWCRVKTALRSDLFAAGNRQGVLRNVCGGPSRTGRSSVQFFRLLLAALMVVWAAGGSQGQEPPAPPSCGTSAPRLAPLDPPTSRNHAQAASGDSNDSAKRASAEARTSAAPLKSRLILGFYCCLVVVASLFGGWLPRRFVVSHLRMQTIISLIAGLMLSIGVFHLLPHAVTELGEDGADRAAAG